MKQLPLIVIVGPTASGKTSLAIEVAEKVKGEIICADSRTVYKGMDIGTAKPTKEEQMRVLHWGIDLVEPDERFTAADFKRYALGKIGEIRARGHTPFLVGGTGLYIDAVVFDYQFGDTADESRRRQLMQLSTEELWMYCNKNNITLPENKHNKRYVIRAIEQNGLNTKRQYTPLEDCIIVGITTNKDALQQRISQRAEQLFDSNVVSEATLLSEKYGWNSEALTGNIYKTIRVYLEDNLSLEAARHLFITLDWRLAKRQLTWFKRNPYVKWLGLTDAEAYLMTLLANK